MNAGHDVERSIAQWLHEESPGRAPDRILANAAQTIDRTKQRRFAVAWREPVSISLRALGAIAAVIVVAIAAAAWLGRSSATIGAAASSHSATIAEYRTAHDAVCASLNAASPIPNFQLWAADKLYDPALPAPDRATSLVVGTALADRWDDVATQLERIQPPPDLATAHIVDVTRLHDIVAILRHEVELLRQGKYADARAADASFGALTALRTTFATSNQLVDCPG